MKLARSPFPLSRREPGPMPVRVIANARSGAVLARGAKAFAADIVAAFSEAGADAEVRLAEGDGVQQALAAALSLPGLRVVIAGAMAR